MTNGTWPQQNVRVAEACGVDIDDGLIWELESLLAIALKFSTVGPRQSDKVSLGHGTQGFFHGGGEKVSSLHDDLSNNSCWVMINRIRKTFRGKKKETVCDTFYHCGEKIAKLIIFEF